MYLPSKFISELLKVISKEQHLICASPAPMTGESNEDWSGRVAWASRLLGEGLLVSEFSSCCCSYCCFESVYMFLVLFKDIL